LEEEWLLEEAGRQEKTGRVLPAPAGGASGVFRKELGRLVEPLARQEAKRSKHSEAPKGKQKQPGLLAD
jgi:hypothetical protein